MIFGKPNPPSAKEGSRTDPAAAAPASPPASKPAAAAPAPAKPAPGAGSSGSTAPAAPAATAAPQGERQAATLRYVDRPDITETFADAISGLVFDGQTLRIEFSVTRLDDVKANTPITGRRYPACRIVLPPGAAVDLINRMQQIAAALTQAGVVKASGPQTG